MKPARPLQSVQTRLFSPLLGLLSGFIMIFSYLAWTFRMEYSSLSQKINDNSKVSRYVFEVTRNRARMQEMLLLFRLNRDPAYVNELIELNSMRKVTLGQIQWLAESLPYLRSLGSSLIGGLEEAVYLQGEMIKAIQENDLPRADRAFYQLSTIFEINSARLKDFSLYLENDLHQNETELRGLLRQIFWTFAGLVALVAMTIFLIAMFYRTSVLRPMRKLHRGLQELARGEMKAGIPLESAPREIYEMINDFNHMVEALALTQAELTSAREEALQAVKIKSEFLANMSHEIRTPMNAIIGMADMLSEGEQNLERRRYLQILKSSGQVLLNVVNDILDFSKLEGGGITFETISFDIRELASRVAQVVEVMARRKGLDFLSNFAPDHPCWVRGDPTRIEQIILNMLGNAVKFTDSGRVTFDVECEVQNQKLRTRLSFSDSGIGIAPEKISVIFSRFGQSDTSITRKYGGTGLGLAIVKQLVDAMQGSLAVSSHLGQGSQFVVELFFPEGDAPAIQMPAHPASSEGPDKFTFEGRVLLVDDAPDNRFLILAYLKKLNCKVEIAEDGKKAVNLYQQNDFDLVLMDMQMPVLDGYEATAQIREIEKVQSRRRTPIVALTAYALAEEVQRSYRAGCDVHLTKPIRKIDLLKTIHHLFRASQGLEHHNPAAPQVGLPPELPGA